MIGIAIDPNPNAFASRIHHGCLWLLMYSKILLQAKISGIII
jgi:hypothetical protein